MACRTEASGISGKPGDEGAAAPGVKRRRMEASRLTKEEEEVVSNMVRVAPCVSSAGGGAPQVRAACFMQTELDACPALKRPPSREIVPGGHCTLRPCGPACA